MAFMQGCRPSSSLQTRIKYANGALTERAQTGVMAACKVVGRILFSADQLLWVKQLAVDSCADLIHHRGLQIQEHRSRDVLVSVGLREEGAKGIVSNPQALVARHLSIWLDAVLKAVKLPTRIADLDACLTDMNGDAFSHIFSFSLTWPIDPSASKSVDRF